MLGLWHTKSRRGRAAIAVLAVMPLVLASACAKKDEEPPPVIGNYVSGVQVFGQESTTEIKNEQLPGGSSEGPAITVTPEATVVNGGSLREPITSAAEFTKIRVAIEAVTASASPSAAPAAAVGSPAKGYYEITLKQAATTAELVLTVAQSLPGTLFVFHYAVVEQGGKQGTSSKQKIEAIQVGTGEVQVSVSWDAASDVDLHVLDPSDEEVYYDHDSSASGGKLDLDSNADCELDNKNNENITWTKAPPGTFAVRLDYWDNCGVDKTNYVVTVRVNGQQPKVFSGDFTGGGDQGGVGDGIPITTFTVIGASPSATA